MVKIVISACFGGFGLSDEALEWLIQVKRWKVTEYNDQGNYIDSTAQIVQHHKKEWAFLGTYSLINERAPEIRVHPDIIEAVETLGEKANGRFAELKIIDIPDDVQWSIEEYDGSEWVAELHRIWR